MALTVDNRLEDADSEFHRRERDLGLGLADRPSDPSSGSTTKW
ncbi:MAG TPA: hypothetical protein VGU26_02445 [Gaiellaceae bacterium]|nr:hypothetical protein [Gaiellaceae bacterium]